MFRNRRWLKVITAAASVTLVLLLLAHTPVVRRHVLALALDRLSQAGLVATADELSYNLLTFDVWLRGVRMSATGSEEAPFLSLDTLHLDLPLNVVLGRMAVQAIDASGVEISIVRRADGTLNLPDFGGSSSAGTLSRVDINRAAIAGANVRYSDHVSGLSLELNGLDLELQPGDRGSRGRLRAARGVSIRRGDVLIDGSFGGELAYDGSSLALVGWTYQAPPARVRVDGRLTEIWSAPALELALDGAVQLEETSQIAGLEPAVEGEVLVKGNIHGPFSNAAAKIAIASQRIAWRHLSATSLNATANATADAIDLSSASMDLGGGSARASGRYAFEPARAEGRLEWSGVEAAALARAESGGVRGVTTRRTCHVVMVGRTRLVGPFGSATVDARESSLGHGAPGLAGTLDLAIDAGVWRLTHAMTIASLAARGTFNGRLAESGLPHSTVEGQLSVSGSDPSATIRALRRAGIAVPQGINLDSGQVGLTARVSGTVAAPRAIVSATLTDGYAAGAGPLLAESTLVADRASIKVERIDASLGGNRASAAGTINLRNGGISGDVTVDVADPGSFGPEIRDTWKPSGQLAGRFAVRGTQSRPMVEGTIDGTAVSIANQQIGQIDAHLSFEAGTVKVRDASITQPDGGRLTAQGTYQLETGRYELNTRLVDVRVSPVVVGAETYPVSSRVEGTFEGTGTLDHPRGIGRLAAVELEWDGHRIENADADVELTGTAALVKARAPSLGTTVDALVEAKAPYHFKASGVTEGNIVPALISLLGLKDSPQLSQLEGSLSTQLKATGTLQEMAAIQIAGTLNDLDLRFGDAVLGLAGPSTLTYDGATVTVAKFRMNTGGFFIEANGSIGPRSPDGLTLSLGGDLDDLADWVSLAGAPSDFAASGALAGTMAVSGPLSRLTVAGAMGLENGSIQWPGYPAVTSVAFQAALSEGVLDASGIGATWQGIAAQAHMRTPLRLAARWLPDGITTALPPAPAPARLEARIDNITPSALAPFAGGEISEALAGRAALAVDLQADDLAPESLNGSIVLDELSLTAEGVPITQLRPTRIDVAGSVARITDWEWDVSGSRFVVRGTAGLTGDRPIDVSADGPLDLRLLGAFLPDVTTNGSGTLSVRVHGPLNNPRADGFVELRNGEVLVTDPAIALVNARGRVLLVEDRIELPGIEAELNGGAVTVIGGVQRSGLEILGGAISLQGQDIVLNVPEGMRTEVRAGLSLRFADRVRLSGRIDVLRGAYREPLSLAAAIASGARRRASTTPVTSDASSILQRTDLDLSIVSSEDLIVDNNYGRMDIGLDLRLAGTVAQPAIVGRAIVREGGVLYLGGRTYQVEQGVIDFTNPRAIVPDLDLSARTRITATDESGVQTEYDVTLSITGTPDNLTTTLTSNPPDLDHADLVSLVATGRLADQAGGAGAAIARDQLLGYLSGETLGFVAQAIGLDTLRLERGTGIDDLQSDPSIASEEDPSQRLTISRRFSRYVNVVLSQNLSENGRLTWIAWYNPHRSVELRTVTRDDRSRAYAVRHDVSFGGTVAATSARTSATTVADRVTSVRFEGEGVPTDELASVISLEPGDRFDFLAWQRDRERLRRYYLDRNHFESRVGARRTQGDNGVELLYEIEPGPVTTFEIEGYRLPGEAIQEIERIWSNAVIDVVLEADLASAVRRHLAQDGYLNATVKATRSPESTLEEKRIRIHINTGESTRQRSVRFSGNEGIETARLQLIVVAVGIGAWLDPADLVDEVLRLYQDEGLLAARVRAAPIEISDGRAVLPISIEEGERFTISRVDVAGVEEKEALDVLAASGLAAGSPYSVGVVERARRALESTYAGRGFIAVHADVEALPNVREGSVVLIVTVNEGSQQILEDIEVIGADGVHPPVIENALELSRGAPASPTAVVESRRQLFNTGMFQRVNIDVAPVDGAADPASGVEPVKARVTLARWPDWRLRYGVEVRDEPAPVSDQGREFGAGITSDVEKRDLFGRPGRFGAAVRYNNDQRIARTYVTFPSLFGRQISSNFFVARTRELFEGEGFLSFITDRTTFTFEQRLNVTRLFKIAYGYQYQKNHVFDPDADPDDPFALDERLTQARLTATLVRDSRDDVVDARSGLFHSSNFEYAPKAVGSDVRFIRYFLQQFAFIPIGSRATAASALRIGVGRGFDDQRLIPSEQFFAGGANTIRGYRQDAIGGFDVFGDPIGGQAVIVLNQEIRFPIYRWVRGAGFIDAGNVFRDAGDLTLTDLKTGTGAGLRFFTPIGLFRLDLGVPVPKGVRDVRWYFAFGQTF